MKNLIKTAALTAALVAVTVPATAQIRLGVGVPDVEVGVNTRVEQRAHVHGPYVYDGYTSGRWHTYHAPARHQVWYSRYNGYDCYDAFQYTYEDGHRVRYDTTFCYDRHDRPYEVRRTRVVVRLD